MGCTIYGTEKVRFKFNYTDEHNAIIATTTTWTIQDVNLSGEDATSTVTEVEATDTVTHQYSSSGNRDVTVATDFDNGWGATFTSAETKLIAKPTAYEPPQLTVTWDPEKPTILEECTFTPINDDTRDSDSTYGLISSVNIDYYDDATIDEVGIGPDDTYSHTFTTKGQGIPIRTLATYNDGWEPQTTELLVHLDMTNIPPVADYTVEDNGICVPNRHWNAATSTDEDGAAGELTYKWWLYKKEDNGTPDDDTDDTWEELETGTEIDFTYPFQFEGDYKLVLRTIDDDGDWTEKTEEFPILFDTCGTGGGSCSGTIILQPNQFQNIAIPVEGVKVKEYFLDKVADIIGAEASTVIELVKAYGSNDVNSNKYQIYVPELTNPLSGTNFELVQTDGTAKEITAFRVKTKDFTGTIEVPWDTADGVQ